mgnify:CR=1 FL=1
MLRLNLPQYNIKVIEKKGKLYVYDIIRNGYFKLTPEEWVRQNFIHHLVFSKGYPKMLMGIEYSISYNNMTRRVDIVLFDVDSKPLLIVECKSPLVEINEYALKQVCIYNSIIKSKYIVITNGLNHYTLFFDKGKEMFLEDVPDYKSITIH